MVTCLQMPLKVGHVSKQIITTEAFEGVYVTGVWFLLDEETGKVLGVYVLVESGDNKIT